MNFKKTQNRGKHRETSRKQDKNGGYSWEDRFPLTCRVKAIINHVEEKGKGQKHESKFRYNLSQNRQFTFGGGPQKSTTPDVKKHPEMRIEEHGNQRRSTEKITKISFIDSLSLFGGDLGSSNTNKKSIQFQKNESHSQGPPPMKKKKEKKDKTQKTQENLVLHRVKTEPPFTVSRSIKGPKQQGSSKENIPSKANLEVKKSQKTDANRIGSPCRIIKKDSGTSRRIEGSPTNSCKYSQSPRRDRESKEAPRLRSTPLGGQVQSGKCSLGLKSLVKKPKTVSVNQSQVTKNSIERPECTQREKAASPQPKSIRTNGSLFEKAMFPRHVQSSSTVGKPLYTPSNKTIRKNHNRSQTSFPLFSFCPKFQIDEILLQAVISSEKHLSAISETLRSQEFDLALNWIEKYIKMGEMEHFFGLESVFETGKSRKIIRMSLGVERVTVVLIKFLIESKEQKKTLQLHLRNMAHYSHRNFLAFIKLFLPKLVLHKHYEAYVEKLSNVISSQKIASLGASKKDCIFALKQGTQILVSLLKCGVRCLNDKIQKALPDLLRSCEKAGLEKIHKQCLALLLPKEKSKELKSFRPFFSNEPTSQSSSNKCSFVDSVINKNIEIIPTDPLKRETQPHFSDNSADFLQCNETPTKAHLDPNGQPTSPSFSDPMALFCSETLNTEPKKSLTPNHPTNSAFEAPGPNPSPPFLAPLSKNYTYTLVMDLDETLGHFQGDGDVGHFLVRPHVPEFLDELSQFFEIVVFTAAVQDYADWIIDRLDQKKRISHRLYRQHCTMEGEVFVKDLGKLGRDLNKVIIVDNMAENFHMHFENGICIKTWIGDVNDRTMLDLGILLKDIVLFDVSDVRVALRWIRDEMIKAAHKDLKLKKENEGDKTDYKKSKEREKPSPYLQRKEINLFCDEITKGIR